MGSESDEDDDVPMSALGARLAARAAATPAAAAAAPAAAAPAAMAAAAALVVVASAAPGAATAAVGADSDEELDSDEDAPLGNGTQNPAAAAESGNCCRIRQLPDLATVARPTLTGLLCAYSRRGSYGVGVRRGR